MTLVLCAVFHPGDRHIPVGDHRQRVGIRLPSRDRENGERSAAVRHQREME